MRRNGRILAINGVLLLVLGAAGWGAYQFLWAGDSGEAASGARTVAVTRTTVVETVSAAASVQSAYTANVNFATSGTVAEINVKVGDVVAAGQQLATVDSAQASAQLAAAESSVDAAEEDLADAKEAADAEETETPAGQAGGTQSVASAQAKLDQAELSLQQAKDALAATVLEAPGAGTVTAINGVVGQRVGGSSGGSETAQDTTSGTDGFIVLTDLANLRVEGIVAEIDVSKVKAGQEATVTINALPDAPVPATVAEIDLTPTTKDNVVQFGVALTLSQPTEGLRPGQSASVAITVAKAEDALALPSAAVSSAGGQNTVTVLSGGQEVTRAIEVGVRSEALIQVTSGLSEGDQVVLTLPSSSLGGGSGAVTGRQGGGGGGGGPVLIPGGGGR
jgi:membrane fusion protein, macrolide-specific efflux system